MSDLKENDELPIDGIQLFLLNKRNNNDNESFSTIHCDIKITHGIYQGITVHTVLNIPPKYPYMAPAMNIASDFEFTHRHHEHVLGTSICNDMLSNFAWFFERPRGDEPPPVASGWSSGYTLNVILSQMQVFFSDPDLYTLPSQACVNELREFALKYKCKECSQKRTYRRLMMNNQTNKTNVSMSNDSNEYKQKLQKYKFLFNKIKKKFFYFFQLNLSLFKLILMK